MPKKNQKKKPIVIGDPLEIKIKLNEKTFNMNVDHHYETVLERLEREFPQASLELIEEIYQKNSRGYISTKKQLDELLNETDNNNKFSKNICFEDQNDKKNNILSNNFKESTKNYTDQTDKSMHEKSVTSNELSMQISGSNSNLSVGGKYIN